MNLSKKKELAARVLNIGKNKIKFAEESMAEIKEAITKQDIRDLFSQGIIRIEEERGRKKKVKRKTRKRAGKKKKKINKKKQEYVKITRKLRAYILELKRHGKISDKEYRELRKKVKSREFKSKSQLRESFLGER